MFGWAVGCRWRWGQKYLNPAFIHAHSAGHSAARSELEVQLSLRLCSDLAHNGFLCANRARSHVSLEQGTSRMARFYCHAIFSLNSTQRPRGPMDKASAYGAGDCRFESCRGHCSTMRLCFSQEIKSTSQNSGRRFCIGQKSASFSAKSLLRTRGA